MEPHITAEKNTASVLAVDIAIVGGAMTGSTLALGLIKLSRQLNRSLNVALIEAFAPSQVHSGFDARAIALAKSSIDTLNQLDIWGLLQHLGCDINTIHVSDKGHFGMTTLNAASFNTPAFGTVVELESVGQVLYDALSQANITFCCPAKVQNLVTDVSGHLITLDSGQQLQAKLLVAADGANSSIRQFQQQPQQQQSFQQHAIIANVTTNKPHSGKAWERFTSSGPLALLPMKPANGNTRLSLVWALDESEFDSINTLSDNDFLAKLQQTFGYRAGQFTAIGKRHHYPLIMSVMERPLYHRTVYIGNAAQALHPIAGQGFNLALRDVTGLLSVIETALLSDQDIGSASVLQQYLTKRNPDRINTLTNVESLVRGFSNQYWPLVIGRNLGLRLLSWIPPLKKIIVYPQITSKTTP